MIEDPHRLDKAAVESFPYLYDPEIPWKSTLFLSYGSLPHELVPFNEQVLERFEPVQVYIKSARCVTW